MPAATHDIVAKLWNLCNVLKDDGVTYHQYVSPRPSGWCKSLGTSTPA